MIDGYTIVEQLHSSARTKVFRAIRTVDKKRLILKVRKRLSSTKNVEHLAKEFEIGKSLEGRISPQYFSIGTFEEQSFLVLSDDQLSDLKSKIPKSGLDVPVFLKLAISITSAMAEIHKQGIIHKDIKPTNVIVDSTLQRAKIIDFEHAAQISAESVGYKRLSVLQGTISYLSPEQTGRINKSVDSRSDLYSLGVTFYQLLTGHLPFNETDPAKLIYLCLAQMPVPVHKAKKDIPKAISIVLEKLMEKSPDRRYQTAAALKEDLLFLQKEFLNHGGCDDFVPGEKETISKLIVFDRLYGRQKESAELLECLTKSRERGQTVIVTGASGVGKTAFISQLGSPVVNSGAFFLCGKFDDLKGNHAYTALRESLSDFVKQCLGQDEVSIQKWRDTISSSVGSLGQVLIDIVPAFEKLIGEQQNLASVSGPETLARRNFVFTNLFRDVCEVNPLILFLDDIQWADSATLSLLENIVETNPRQLLVVFSCRTNELSRTSAAKTFVSNLSDRRNVKSIDLGNLTLEDLSSWLDDIFPSPIGDDEFKKKELATLIMAKTKGNSFYVRSLLLSIIRNNYIRRKENGDLFLDIDGIVSIAADNNIIEHLLKDLERLTDEDVTFLSKISVLGNRIPISLISLFLKTEPRQVDLQIQSLVDAHLLLKIENSISFAHDRVRQAARELVDAKKMQSLHLVAGKTIRDALDDQNSDGNNIEQYIHHFNLAEPLISSGDQRIELAKLNFLEGKRQKNNAAYKIAENSFAQAIVFLPENKFDTYYQFSMDLYTEYGEMLFLGGDYEKGDAVFEEVTRQSKSAIDCTNAYVTQISHYASHHQPARSMEIAVKALLALGIKLPQKGVKLAVLAGLLKVKFLLRNKTTKDLSNIPTTDDPLTLAQMSVLSAAAVPAYIGFPSYIPLIIFWMMRLSVTKGNCISSPFAYCSYGLVLCNLKKPKAAMAYGELAIALIKKLKSKKLYAKVPYMFGAFIHHWNAPMMESTAFFEQAVLKGMDVGDYEFASYAAANTFHHSFYAGESINKLLSRFPKTHKTLAIFNKDHAIYQARYLNQLLLVMNDPHGDGISVDGDLVSEHELLLLLEEQKALPSLAFCKISKMQLAYLARDFKVANQQRIQAVNLLEGLMGTIYSAICHFFAALTCIAQYRNSSEKRLLRDAKASYKILKGYGKKSPANYLCQATLINAELFSLGNNGEKTIALYEKSIQSAAEIGNNLVHGIAGECLGRYLIKRGMRTLGLLQIKESISVFFNWGALNKSTRLGEEFGIAPEAVSGDLDKSVSISTSREVNSKLELDALTTAIKTLTSDLNIGSLLETLLSEVMQHSGATKALYIVVENKQFLIHSEKNIYRVDASNRNENKTDAQVKTTLKELPVELLEQCAFDARRYVLKNVIKQPHAQKSEAKSVLIIPLKRQQVTTGLVYLENSLMEDAFRAGQVQFLSLLAGQAAIAIENALVFQTLKKERNYSANVVNNSPALICGIDAGGITTFANPATEKITGYGQGELIGENWWQLFFPTLEYKQVEQLFAASTNGQDSDLEMQFTCKNGDKKSIVWNSFTKKNDKGDVVETIGFGTDVTERKRSEEAIKLFQSAADFSTDAIGMSTFEGKHYYQNAAFDKLFGTISLVGEDASNLYVDEKTARDVFASIKGGQSWTGEIQMYGPNKAIVDILLRAYAIKDSNGSVITLIGLHTDITKRKQSEAELRQLRNYLSNIIDSMPSLLIGVDCNLKVTQWNKKAEQTTGIEAVSALGRDLCDVLPQISSESDSIAQSISSVQTIQKLRKPRVIETGTCYEDIIIYPLVTKSSAGQSDRQAASGAVVKITDVTDRVLMEEMIVQSEKMLSVGGLAAGMAHEINNPLAGMMQSATVLNNRLRRVDLPANIRAAERLGVSMETIDAFMAARGIPAMLDNIIEAGTRASKIVSNMLSFSRKSESVSAKCDLKNLLDQSVELARSSFNLEKKFDFKRIKIVREYPDEIPLVLCEAAKIQQVIMNVLRNGAEAMQCETIENQEPCFVFRLVNKTDDKMVCMEIEDNGPGMTEDIRKRIFEPFYTTKAAGSGTGLGLSLSYFIVTENHGGKMTVISSPGKGTTFLICLPVS